MDISEIIIAGDTAGIEWRLPVFRFKGRSPDAPKTYIQAALHANELPGTALAHFLLQKLADAEKNAAILGDITVVPQANPIGTAQSHFGELQGRFDLGSRTNFNRDFPLIALGERDSLLEDLDRYSATDRLKRQLLHMALGADLMLDLHCDDEALQYAYIDDAFGRRRPTLPQLSTWRRCFFRMAKAPPSKRPSPTPGSMRQPVR